MVPFFLLPARLPFLPPNDLADFIAFPTAFLVNILTIVFTTTLPIPPICLRPLLRQGTPTVAPASNDQS
ncbi:MAG: hypothetical protein AVDCRST_MAG02-475 [uncultured Rubrobacteraceae bacterium]|uniref:Uncharacterized protein n=1 Tax=uncultured Rubrobacteraceae bacterium TaxID=349277 RepID=A0A6J4QR04_9ACTN|nr:MAG: hypothetical protein AVDCRST_MAG02-475 [uncultured Rubrobacteraceae bacterium]